MSWNKISWATPTENKKACFILECSGLMPLEFVRNYLMYADHAEIWLASECGYLLYNSNFELSSTSETSIFTVFSHNELWTMFYLIYSILLHGSSNFELLSTTETSTFTVSFSCKLNFEQCFNRFIRIFSVVLSVLTYQTDDQRLQF